MMLTTALIDELLDFDDPAESEARLRVELERGGPYDGVERAELRTLLARTLGLQERYDDAAEMLIEVESEDAPVVIARVLLESGRILNSAGKPDDSAPLFLRAAEIAAEVRLDFLRIDALHMLAIAKPSNADHWTAQAVELAEASTDPRTQRWLISLHNNLGWVHFDEGDFDIAIAEFTEAARWADLVGTEQQKQWAAEALAEASSAIASDEA
jgi:tetratricopeptide (TPR) repeat protein